MVSNEILKKIRRIEIVSNRLVESVLSGNYLSTFHGQGLEFSEVREYQPGDEVRFIDWNVTARQGRPFIKVHQEERELTVILAVDLSASMDFGSSDVSKRELAAQVAATLGFSAAVNGDRVGFLFFTDRVEAWLPPKRGKRHLLRGLRDLLVLEPKGRGTNFEPAVARLASVARRGAAVFWISDFAQPDFEKELRTASRRFDLIAARMTDPAEQALPRFAGLIPARDPESGKLGWLDTDWPWALKRHEKAQVRLQAQATQALRRLQVDVLDAQGGREFAIDLVRFFKRRAGRRGH